MIIIFLLITCLCSCSHSLINQGEDGIIVYAIRKSNNFSLVNQGLINLEKGQAYNKEEGTIKEYYQTKKYRFHTVDEARRFFVKLLQDYIKPYNNDRRLRATLPHFPLTASDIQIQVTFTDDYGSPLSNDLIAQVTNSQGKLSYYTYDTLSKQFLLLFQEPIDSIGTL